MEKAGYWTEHTLKNGEITQRANLNKKDYNKFKCKNCNKLLKKEAYQSDIYNYYCFKCNKQLTIKIMKCD